MVTLDIVMAACRAAQRGLMAGCAVMVGTPPWTIPPLLLVIHGFLGWYDSRSRLTAAQAAFDGLLGGLAGIGLAPMLFQQTGLFSWPIGLAVGCGTVGGIIAAVECLFLHQTSSKQRTVAEPEQVPPA
jgi:hypothetical protein